MENKFIEPISGALKRAVGLGFFAKEGVSIIPVTAKIKLTG